LAEYSRSKSASRQLVYPFKCDVSSTEQVAQLHADVKKIGDVTVLINNAAVCNVKKLLELNEKEIREVFDVNIISHFWLCKQFLPKMIELNRGHIINVSSVLGIIAGAQLCDYSATKFAVCGFTEALRVELNTLSRINKIKVSVVCPFHIKTNLFREAKFKYLNWTGLSMDPDYVANEIIHGMRLNKDTIYVPRLIPMIMSILKGTQIGKFCDYANMRLAANGLDDIVSHQREIPNNTSDKKDL